MRKKILFRLLIAVVVVIYIIVAQKYSSQQKKRLDEQFYSADIEGRLEKMDYYAHGVRIKVEGNEERVVFYPNVSEESEITFENLAKPGDGIIKPAYSDTLQLIHGGRLYLFTFRVFM